MDLLPVLADRVELTFRDPVAEYPDGRPLDAGTTINPGYREIRLVGNSRRHPVQPRTIGATDNSTPGGRRIRRRCGWAKTELGIAYHDKEWGVPQHDDRVLFEFLILEGAQAGLSWETILRKRENYRAAFARFDPKKVAQFTPPTRSGCSPNEGIVRNRLKVSSAITNAKAFLDVQREFGSFDKYVWGFVGGKPIRNAWESLKDVPAKTTESDAMSKDLLKRGFRFVGSTICYAYMQAVGMVNDHEVGCFRYKQVSRPRVGLIREERKGARREMISFAPSRPSRINRVVAYA